MGKETIIAKLEAKTMIRVALIGLGSALLSACLSGYFQQQIVQQSEDADIRKSTYEYLSRIIDDTAMDVDEKALTLNILLDARSPKSSDFNQDTFQQEVEMIVSNWYGLEGVINNKKEKPLINALVTITSDELQRSKVVRTDKNGVFNCKLYAVKKKISPSQINARVGIRKPSFEGKNYSIKLFRGSFESAGPYLLED